MGVLSNSSTVLPSAGYRTGGAPLHAAVSPKCIANGSATGLAQGHDLLDQVQVTDGQHPHELASRNDSASVSRAPGAYHGQQQPDAGEADDDLPCLLYRLVHTRAPGCRCRLPVTPAQHCRTCLPPPTPPNPRPLMLRRAR